MIKKIYSTGDLYEASALKTAGLRFIRITRNGARGVFEFEDSPEREKLVTTFYSGDLVLNVRSYVDCWLNLKRLVSGERKVL